MGTSTMPEQGPYSPLRAADGINPEIRLLSLAPGEYDDPIEITLTTYSIPSMQPKGVVLQKLIGLVDSINTEHL
jgi:hypothetical protein